jgi:cytochrome c553
MRMTDALTTTFPPPLRGRDREGGPSLSLAFYGNRRTPTPNPSPQGGGERVGVCGTLAAIALLLVATSPSFAAGNVAAGRQKALQCQACHGMDGLSKMPEAPNIAGNPEQYLVRQMNAFRKGERKNEMMSVVVQQLKDQDIADLAAYYAAIEVTVTVPK